MPRRGKAAFNPGNDALQEQAYSPEQAYRGRKRASAACSI